MERSHLDMILGKNHIITTTDLGALKFNSFLSSIFIFIVIKSNPMVKECDRVVWITGIHSHVVAKEFSHPTHERCLLAECNPPFTQCSK